MARYLTRLGGPSKSGETLYGFDKLALRLERKLTKPQLAWLRKRSRNVNQRLGRPMGKQRCPHLLTIVAPNRAAMEMLATLPESTFVNQVELAMDVLADTRTETMAMTRRVHRSFVQPHHGNRKTLWVVNGFYSGQRGPGLIFVAYGDRDSKLTYGRYPAFHIEARLQSAGTCRSVLNVNHPRDLLAVDHHAFWQKHGRFYQLDLARLGRHHRNSVRGERRKTPEPDDVFIGSVLFRGRTDEHRTIQSFVDAYGMGPWLRRVPIALFIPETPRREDVATAPCCNTDMTSHTRCNTTPTATPRNRGNGRTTDTTGTCTDEHARKHRGINKRLNSGF